jgi:type I restriction enzyme, S subunit
MKEISVSAPLSFMLNGEFRLDATFYTSAVFLAKKYLNSCAKKGTQIKTVADFSSGTYNPPPIKRIFTDDKKKGTPYMLPQEMYDFFWEPRKFVLADKMSNIGDWFLKNGWIVLSQSGTVGKPYYATHNDEKTVLSQNAIRIPPKSADSAGFVYAYLSTWIGQTLLKKDEFGITVKHIRPHHVDTIPIPDLPKGLQRSVSNKIQKAFELRAEAIKLIKEAKQDIYKAIGAPSQMPISETEPDDSDDE